MQQLFCMHWRQVSAGSTTGQLMIGASRPSLEVSLVEPSLLLVEPSLVEPSLLLVEPSLLLVDASLLLVEPSLLLVDVLLVEVSALLVSPCELPLSSPSLPVSLLVPVSTSATSSPKAGLSSRHPAIEVRATSHGKRVKRVEFMPRR